MTRPLCIAIDGPAGAGKSTVAKEVAHCLGILYLDTGAMYRAVAWLAVRHGVDPSNERAILSMLDAHKLDFEPSRDGGIEVYCDGICITDLLRTPEVSDVVSLLSVHPGVRHRLTEWQRHFGQTREVVMDGRDIGTVVMPDAPVKVFLTADISERAKRRAQELRDKGFDVAMDEIRTALLDRDVRDSSRDEAPLKRADDAHCIDSTGKTVEEVVREILTLVKQVMQRG